MAFVAGNLATQNVGAHRTRAHYFHPTDAQAAIVAANYFNDAYLALPKGTVIETVAAMDSTPVAKDYVVTASSVAGVTIAAKT